jgi:hypothetical protein
MVQEVKNSPLTMIREGRTVDYDRGERFQILIQILILQSVNRIPGAMHWSIKVDERYFGSTHVRKERGDWTGRGNVAFQDVLTEMSAFLSCAQYI